MHIDKIKKLAEDNGLALCMYDRPRMTVVDDKTCKWIASGELTYYGKHLVDFANAIEKELASCRT